MAKRPNHRMNEMGLLVNAPLDRFFVNEEEARDFDETVPYSCFSRNRISQQANGREVRSEAGQGNAQ